MKSRNPKPENRQRNCKGGRVNCGHGAELTQIEDMSTEPLPVAWQSKVERKEVEPCRTVRSHPQSSDGDSLYKD